MRWGFIGTGAHARTAVAPALVKTAGHTLVGSIGSAPGRSEEFADVFGGKAWDHLDDLLATPDCDAVFISTPNHQHCAQVKAAAAAGKHVLVEKPMALNATDCEAMIAACRSSGVMLGIGFQRRFHPVAQNIQKLITSGELGDIVMMHATFHTAYAPWQNWRADPTLSGADILAAVGVHLFDLLCWFDPSDVIRTSAIVDRSDDSGMDQSIAANLQFQSGALATASITRRARAQHNGIWVYGTNGMAGGPAVLGANSNGKFATRIGEHYQELTLPMCDMFEEQFLAFERSAQTGQAHMATGQDGLASVLLSDRLLAA